MKNSLKRLTALLLAMAMCLSLLSANVWAAELEPQAESETASVDVTEDGAESVQSDEEISGDESNQKEDATEGSAPEEEPEESAQEEDVAEESVPEGEPKENLIETTAEEESSTEQEEAAYEEGADEILVNGKNSQLEVQQNYTANVNYFYSSGVTVGTVRYISQVTSGSHYHSEYWGNWGSQAGIECGTASISMALSYVGINKTPKNILDDGSGITYFGWNWGGAQHNSPSLSNAINNFTDGNGKYSPPIIHLNSYSNAGHYLLIIGRNGSSLTTLDPWECSVSSMTISGSTVTYSKSGTSRSETISDVHQYYNSNAVIPNPTPTPTISGANSPGTLTVGSVFSIKGTVSCGQSLTNVTAGVYDADGNMKTGKSASPNSTSYNIVGLDNEVYFNHLSPGVYRYKVSATASGKTTVLLNKDFIVLAKSDTVSPGTYMIEPCGNSAVVADVGDNSSNVLLENKCSRDSQLFEITSIGNGYYHIKNVETGKMLDVSGAGSAPETNVQIYEANDSPAQNWQILPVMDGYALVPQCGTSNCLDVYNAAFNNGANLQVYTAHLSNLAQRFRLKTVTKSPVSGKGNRIAFDMQGGTVSEPIKTMSVGGLNTRRTTQALVIYSIEGLKPFTNHYGREASVDSSGKVTAIREYDSDTQLTVPSGGFIISGHTDYGKGGIEFVNTLSVGTYVGYNAETKVASAYRDRNSYLFENKYVDNGGTYGDLPAPHKNGYTFTGWYTSAQGGSRIRKSGTYSAKKLYAHWEKTGEEKAASEQTYQGHRYELYDYLMTWEEANEFCQGKGGHLATIASSQENEIVANLVPKSESAWIGATDKDKEGTFSWATGESFSYSKWEQNEPNDYGGNEDYAEILSSGVWNDNSGTALRPFICEYDTEKTTTSISSCTVTLSENNYTYDGNAKTPSVTVRDGSKTLAKGTDYEVSYRNNVEVGTATVTITGKGNYTGSVERTFTISKENTPAGAAVFTVGSVSAAPGGQITVPVSITKNPGIAGFALDIAFDDSLLTLTNAAAVSALGGTFTQNSDTVTWYSDGNVNRTGKAFELTFTVSGNANNTQTDVSLSMHDGKQNVTDENYASVTTSFEKGTVTIRSSGTPGDVTGDNDVTIADVVKVNRHVAGRITLTGAELLAADVTGDGDVTIADVVKINRFVSGKLTTLAATSGLSTQAAGDVTITVGSVSASAGKTVSVPVSISGNSGVAGMALEFTIPSGLKLNSITAGDVLKDGAFTQNGTIITWYATDNVYRDGVILKLNVTAPESSGSYTVKATLKDGKASNLSDESSNSVGVNFEAGTVNVSGGATSTLAKTKLSSVKYDKKKKTVTVKWKKNTKGKGYEVECSTDKKFKKSVKTVKISNNKTVKTTVKKLKKGTWYFRIRTVKGKKYSGWSTVKKVKVDK